jgi:hypothetical protein
LKSNAENEQQKLKASNHVFLQGKKSGRRKSQIHAFPPTGFSSGNMASHISENRKKSSSSNDKKILSGKKNLRMETGQSKSRVTPQSNIKPSIQAQASRSSKKKNSRE